MPLPIDLSLMMLTGICLGTAIAVGLAQAVASAVGALLGPSASARPQATDSRA